MKENHKTYRLFYTWQNDRKDTKKIIRDALNEAIGILAKNGIELYIDQDTRDRKGKKKIEEEVLSKIRQSDIFVADLTPVTTLKPANGIDGVPKHMPNSNVMYEYGYAQHCKGDAKIIALASLAEGEHVEYMPFDINHDTITQFKTKEDLKDLSQWILNIIKEIDEERNQLVPDYGCDVVFENQTKDLEVTPTYKRVSYFHPIRIDVNGYAKPVNPVDVLLGRAPLDAIIQESNSYVQPKIVAVKAEQKEIYRSYSRIKLLLHNSGNMALINSKLYIKTDCAEALFKRKNEKSFFSVELIETNTIIVNDKNASRNCGTINPGDCVDVGEFFVYVPVSVETFHLKWQLSNLHHQPICGELTVKVCPQYHDVREANDNKVGSTEIIEYIEKVY